MTRQHWVEEKRITDKPKPGREKKLDGKQEAFLVALAYSDAPGERESWTMQLLADRLVELGVVDEPISDETVRRTLKKTNCSPGAKNSGASPRWAAISSGVCKMCSICTPNPFNAFTPEEVRRILRKLEFHFTPKHGSIWQRLKSRFSVGNALSSA